MSRLILLGKESQGEKSHSVSYFELQQTLRQLECYAEMCVGECEVCEDSNTGFLLQSTDIVLVICL
jgi:hypothetical protein